MRHVNYSLAAAKLMAAVHSGRYHCANKLARVDLQSVWHRA
jgi:hypothetical protein